MESIKTFSQNGTIIGFAIASIIMIAFSYITNCIEKKKIQKEYPNEVILHYFEPHFFIIFSISALIGYIIGGAIIPFCVFPDAEKIDWFMSKSFLPYFVIANMYGIYIVLILLLTNVALTNKRIIRRGFIKYKGINRDIKIEDIEKINYNPTFPKQLIITLKNGEIFKLAVYRSLKKFYEKLTKLLEIEKNKGGG